MQGRLFFARQQHFPHSKMEPRHFKDRPFFIQKPCPLNRVHCRTSLVPVKRTKTTTTTTATTTTPLPLPLPSPGAGKRRSGLSVQIVHSLQFRHFVFGNLESRVTTRLALGCHTTPKAPHACWCSASCSGCMLNMRPTSKRVL